MSSQIVGRPMEILLVEDSLMDARVTIEALRSGNVQHRLTLVRDGDEAIQFVRQEGRFARAPRPDLILLDLMLPKRTGLEVLAELSQDFELKQKIPVVVLTASDNEGQKRLTRPMTRVDSLECGVLTPLSLFDFVFTYRVLGRASHERNIAALHMQTMTQRLIPNADIVELPHD